MIATIIRAAGRQVARDPEEQARKDSDMLALCQTNWTSLQQETEPLRFPLVWWLRPHNFLPRSPAELFLIPVTRPPATVFRFSRPK